MGQLIGYARTSTGDQVYGLEDQLEVLKAAGCDKIFSEHASGIAEKPELEKCLAYVREGDTLIATKPDRLSRSARELLSMVETIQQKGVHIKVLSLGLDTSSPVGKLALTMLAAFAEFEREIMLERQRAGIRRAQADGAYRGAWRFRVWRVQDDIKALRAGGMGTMDIARKLGVSRASVWRHEKGLITNPHITDQRDVSESPPKAAKVPRKKAV